MLNEMLKKMLEPFKTGLKLYADFYWVPQTWQLYGKTKRDDYVSFRPPTTNSDISKQLPFTDYVTLQFIICSDKIIRHRLSGFLPCKSCSLPCFRFSNKADFIVKLCLLAINQGKVDPAGLWINKITAMLACRPIKSSNHYSCHKVKTWNLTYLTYNFFQKLKYVHFIYTFHQK